MVTPIIMDGITYRVRVVYDTMQRNFTLLSGANAGTMLSQREERDLIGTGFSYDMNIEPDPQYIEDYDAFYQAISAPVDTHTITLPYGQTTITYEAMIEGGTDTYRGKLGNKNMFHGLRITCRYIEPQRVVSDS